MDDQMTVIQLRKLLSLRGLSTSGNKSMLIARLQGSMEEDPETYDVNLSEDPRYANRPFNQKISLSPQGLGALALTATAFLGPDRDRYFRIYTRQLRLVNLDSAIQKSALVLLEGEAVIDDLTEANWTIDIQDLGITPTMKYTLRLDAPYGIYLLQFDHLDILKDLMLLPLWLGLDPKDYFRDLHQGSQPLTL